MVLSYDIRNDRRQFLQVSFTTLVKLRRLSIQGLCDSIGNDTDRYVTSFKVYYSTNGALWSAVMEGSNVKVCKLLSKSINENHIAII